MYMNLNLKPHGYSNGQDPLEGKTPVYTTEVDEGLSSHYARIQTSDIVDSARAMGLVPVHYTARRTRTRNPDFVTHEIVLREETPRLVEGEVLKSLYVRNSHNGLGSCKIIAGLYRVICQNGLAMADAGLSFSIRHLPNQVAQLPTALASAWGATNLALEYRERMLSKPWDYFKNVCFANEAASVRWPDQRDYLLNTNALSRRRRDEDAPMTLWHTYNVVQENLLEGAPFLETHDCRAVRRLTGLAARAKVNADLFQLAKSYL